MADVPQRTYTDPTAAMMNALLQLGGAKEKQTTSTSSDPAAAAALQQILNTQLGGTTPEGSAALLKAIFQQGMEQVPGLATTYGQAAGARTSNNGGLAQAMQDLMVKLTAEGARQVRANQDSATTTATRLADSTKSTTTSASKSPKTSALQLLPFALANADKLKKLAGDAGTGVTGLLSQSPLFSSNVSDVASSGVPDFGITVGRGDGDFGALFDTSGINLGSDVGTNLASDLGSSLAGGLSEGLDFGAIANSIADVDYSSFLDSGGDFLGFAEGGLVSKAKNVLRANPQAEAAFASGGDDKTSTSPARKEEGGNKADDREGTVRGSSGNLAAQLINIIRARNQPSGYATGGVVSADRFSNITDNAGRSIRGITYNDTASGVNELLTSLMEMPAGYGIPKKRGNSNATDATVKKTTPDMSETAGSSGVGEGLATGQVGTVAENEAALGGMVALGLATALGLPSAAVSMGLNAIGVPVASMSPFSHIASLISGMVQGNGSSGIDATSGMAPPEGSMGMSVGPSAVGNTGISTSGQSQATQGGLDAVSEALGIGSGIDGAGGGDGSGGTGSGTSAGGAAGVGGGTGDGDGTGGFARGGEVDGPKGRDVIPAMLTDGEFVIKQKSVSKIGEPILHFANNYPDEFAEIINSAFARR